MRLLAVALLFAATAVAQLPRGFYPWWDQPIAKDLNLTDAQSKEIRAAVREYRGKLIDARAALQKAEVELQYAFDDDSVDARRASQAIEDLANARENLTRTFSQLALRLRMVLTAQQWRELQKRHEEQQQQKQQQRPANPRRPG
jgi:Spy/CpxP family protein refolding chaperone